jgi:hypothetical protein
LTSPHAQPLTQLRTSSIDGLLSGLATATREHPELPLYLDLSALAHLERPAGTILTNALVGTFGELPLRIALPASGSQTWLSQSGLAFALANRSGPTTLEGIDHPDELLAPWRQYWLPGAELTEEPAGEQPLFDPAEIGETENEPDVTGSHYAAFVDPHRSSRDVGSHPLNTFVWPWLDRLLPHHRPRHDRSGQRRRTLIEDIGHFVDETVRNIAQHAATSMPDVRSLLQVSVTRGGGTRSFDRIYVTVQDTGPGITSTARRKIDPVIRATIDDRQLLFKLFDGSLPPWGRGRGMGLPKVREICATHSGTLHVATQLTRLRAQRGRPRMVAWTNGVLLHGSVVVLMLPLSSK